MGKTQFLSGYILLRYGVRYGYACVTAREITTTTVMPGSSSSTTPGIQDLLIR